MDTSVRQSGKGESGASPGIPIPPLKQTNKQTLSLVPGKNRESTPCKLQIKCQDDVSHICHVTRSQYAFQQGSVCIKNNVNICKTNKALGTDLFSRGVRSYENVVGKNCVSLFFQSRIITKNG